MAKGHHAGWGLVGGRPRVTIGPPKTRTNSHALGGIVRKKKTARPPSTKGAGNQLENCRPRRPPGDSEGLWRNVAVRKTGLLALGLTMVSRIWSPRSEEHTSELQSLRHL